MFWHLLAVSLAFGLPAEPATGQQPGRDTTALPPPLPPDTFPFFYSFAQNHEQAYPAADTLPDNDFRMY
ncbi:MAG: hypothetical protein ABMA02_17445, partial [Saprospiraceae bacterium]